ncbi:Esc1 [Kluyveromyces lactis]|nr:Esc1 [Kluyveromyces lactis]
MHENPNSLRFRKNGASKSFRRFASPFSSKRRVQLTKQKQSNATHQLTAYRRKDQNDFTRRLLSHDTDATVSVVESLIEKGKKLLKSVSKEETSLRNEVEAELRNKQLRLQYVNEIMEDNVKSMDQSDSKGFSASDDIRMKYEADSSLESEGSIVILSDNEGSENIHTMNKNASASIFQGQTSEYSEGDSINLSESGDSSHPESIIEQAEPSDDEDDDLFNEYSDNDLSENIASTPRLKQTFMQAYAQKPGNKTIDSVTPRDPSVAGVELEDNDFLSDNNSEDNIEHEEDVMISDYRSSDIRESKTSGIFSHQTLSDKHNLEESEDSPEYCSTDDEKLTNDELASNYNESKTNVKSEEELPSDQESDLMQDQPSEIEDFDDGEVSQQISSLPDEFSIANQAIAQLNAHATESDQSVDDVSDKDIYSEESYNKDEAEEAYEDETEKASNKKSHTSAEVPEIITDEGDMTQLSLTNTHKLRSDGIGELGEYSYQLDTNNNGYGLITDNDHSLILKTLHERSVPENVEYSKNNVNTTGSGISEELSETSVQDIDFASNVIDVPHTSLSETEKEIFAEPKESCVATKEATSVYRQERNIGESEPRYCLTFSDSFSEDDNPQNNANAHQTQENFEYQSVFSSDPFHSDYNENTDKTDFLHDLLLNTLGDPASDVTQNPKCSQQVEYPFDHELNAETMKGIVEEASEDFQMYNMSSESPSDDIFHDALDVKHSFPISSDLFASKNVQVSPEKKAEHSSMTIDHSINENKPNIPLFIDKETIRLTTSPVRINISNQSEKISSDASIKSSSRRKLENNLNSTLFQQPSQHHNIPLFNLNSSQTTNNNLPNYSGGTNSHEKAGSTSRVTYPNPLEPSRTISDHDLATSSREHESELPASEALPDDKPVIRIPLLVHRTEAHEAASPFEDSAQAKTSTELSEYVESLMEDPNREEVDEPIVTEPADMRVRVRTTSYIEIEEIITENINNGEIEKITTEPEVSFRESPEPVHRTVELEELAVEQEINVETQKILHFTDEESLDLQADELSVEVNENESKDELQRSNIQLSISNTDITLNIPDNSTSASDQRPYLPSVTSVHDISETGQMGYPNNENDFLNSAHQGSPSVISSSWQENACELHADFNSDEPSLAVSGDVVVATNDGLSDGKVNKPSSGLLYHSEISSTLDSLKSPSPEPTLGKRILASPLKMLNKLAEGVRSIEDAATEFASLVDPIVTESDSDSANSNHSRTNSAPSEPEHKQDHEENKSENHSREEFYVSEEVHSVKESNELHDAEALKTLEMINKTTDKIKHYGGTDLPKDTPDEDIDTIPTSVIIDDSTELHLAPSNANPITSPSQKLKTSTRAGSIPIEIENEESGAADIPVTIEKTETAQQRTPVKKRPRSTENSSPKPSKRKRSKKRKQARKITSVARNLRSKSKKR